MGEFLWDITEKGQVEVPSFVMEHDEELENRPLMDYALEANPHVDGPGLGMSRFAARTDG